MKIILPCLCEELWNLGWIVTIYVYSPKSITQQDGCVCTSEPGVLWAKYLLSLHPNKLCWKYCSRWLLTLCLPACFSKRILNKALDPSIYMYLTSAIEINSLTSMGLVTCLCSGLSAQQQHNHNLREHQISNPFLIHEKSSYTNPTLMSLSLRIPVCHAPRSLWINIWLTSLTDEIHEFFIHYRFWLSPKELPDLILWGLKSSIVRKGIRCWVLAGFDRYKLIVMKSVNMLSKKESKSKIGKKKRKKKVLELYKHERKSCLSASTLRSYYITSPQAWEHCPVLPSVSEGRWWRFSSRAQGRRAHPGCHWALWQHSHGICGAA